MRLGGVLVGRRLRLPVGCPRSVFLSSWERSLKALARKPQTGVSLRGLVDAGKNHLVLSPEDLGKCSKVLLTIASFLHHELPIRLARRVVELDGLPSLHEMKSVRRVREWYARSASEISAAPKPTDEASERAFAALSQAARGPP